VAMLEEKHVEHQKLMDAVLARDGVLAGELMYQHLLTPIPIIRGAMGVDLAT